VITEQQGQELADELAIRFMEASAKNSINVEEAFFTLARSVSFQSDHLLSRSDSFLTLPPEK
jgi:Ras-related protein Rab-8A